MLAGRVSAQTFTTLHKFTGRSDGRSPSTRLILSGNSLFGVAQFGGGAGNGTLFKVNTNGTGFMVMHTFTGWSPEPYPSSDGAVPNGGLLLSGNTLYGTTDRGGSSGDGSVFAVNTDGTGYSSFITPGSPQGALILSGDTLYGTTSGYGFSGRGGTVFSLSFRPQLTIIPSGPSVLIVWPTNSAGLDHTGYILQSATNLLSPTVWTSVVPGPVVIGGQNVVVSPVTGTQKFYR